ncbi:pyridoxal phosphate-dependent aminotransferase [Ideonella dechloratans]|uniref:Pyridoxal phosphate-dependent aminotransferase n=1 Tax=Ideonella dechloratans TaxID=36863 RepID=A0A643F814_IDEDE|nr:pyridoxal phosphate-dependent aminotransferase [Ideonella dechloratans]KAB0577058.1 pyridoxal phosphate-dependent aminotransferase [Ideonella dechloratans]UFU08636.1 pyridoxal phosphate-dependent aminotransferase [Ideonella dechloratans]
MSFDPRTPPVQSRLPQVGTTIFTVMSALAQQHDAVNLGQGFPDFQGDPALLDAVNRAMREGHNQYPPMAGVPALREAIAGKIAAIHGHHYDPGSDITVTAGATQAILTAVLALVQPGDEVVVLEPCYDSYEPSITLAGARTVRVPLDPQSLHVDFDRLAAALTPRTRLLIINTPHNPSGMVWTEDERAQLRDLLRPTDILVLSDEVYEHMVFEGRPHASVSGDPELAARSIVVSSFGKTFHVTGWKVGYVAAPAPLMAEFRKVHQFNVFTVNTPMQHGLAAYLADPAPYRDLPAFYQRKRDLFRQGLATTRFQLLPCEGTYFQCVDYSAISDLGDAAFCQWLIEHAGVAAIPLSAFYAEPPKRPLIRFCFAKQDETLTRALARLQAL